MSYFRKEMRVNVKTVKGRRVYIGAEYWGYVCGVIVCALNINDLRRKFNDLSGQPDFETTEPIHDLDMEYVESCVC